MSVEIVASVRRRVVGSIAATSSVFAVFTALAYLKSVALIRSSSTHIAESGLGMLQMYLTVGFFLGGIAALAACYVLNRSVCRPLERLDRLAGMLGQGNLATDVEGCTDKGIDAATVHVNAFAHDLGEKLDDMIDSLSLMLEEVRKLAERTMRATGEISETIGTVQSETNQTKHSMEAAAGQVTHSRDAIVQMGETLKGITETVQNMHERMTNIAMAVEQQSAATEEISASTERSAAISTTINTSARRVLKDVNTMTSIVDRLRGSFGNIKTRNLDNKIIELSKGDHRLWVNKVAAHINGDAKLDMANAADHTQCRLGGWYYAEGMAKCGAMPSFRAMEEPHRRIHALGREIIGLVDQGKREQAKVKFKEMEEVSAEVISLLEALDRACKH